MTVIKNLGHYEGMVEEIDPFSKKFEQLDQRHKTLIRLDWEKIELKAKLKEIEAKIAIIKEDIKPEAFNDQLDWTWIYNRKRTNVKWKEEFIKHCGSGKAQEIATQYKQKEYPTIGIKYIDPTPESIKQVKKNPPKFSRKLKLKNQ